MTGSAQWSREKVRSVPQLQLKPIDCKLLEQDIAEARLRPRNASSQGVKRTQPDKDKTDCIYCSRCACFLARATSPTQRKLVSITAAEHACGRSVGCDAQDSGVTCKSAYLMPGEGRKEGTRNSPSLSCKC